MSTHTNRRLTSHLTMAVTVLHDDAPPVPTGLRPRPGVEYGCGVATCRDCYEVIPRFHLRPADMSGGRHE